MSRESQEQNAASSLSRSPFFVDGCDSAGDDDEPTAVVDTDEADESDDNDGEDDNGECNKESDEVKLINFTSDIFTQSFSIRFQLFWGFFLIES